jgi:quinoprotein glucose dehydrogenase
VCVVVSAAVAACAGRASRAPTPPTDTADWLTSGGTAANLRHADVTTLTPATVGRLVKRWEYRTGELAELKAMRRWMSLEATPVLVADRLVVSTPLGRVIALDPLTGEERWRRDLGVAKTWKFDNWHNRGVVAWEDSTRAPGAPCRVTVYAVSIDARLFAFDAPTGTPCTGFGQRGVVSLRDGLRTSPRRFEDLSTTSPPVVVQGVLVVGTSVADNGDAAGASGEVRGFDARTGALRWSWDPLARDGAAEPSASSAPAGERRTGGANAWSLLAADEGRGLVFAPTGSASPDAFGGQRPGPNRHANSVVAIDVATGRTRWSFQLVHHDLWDYDNAAPPVLTEVSFGGRRRDVVIQANKSGMVFVLDRDTGEPVWPVEERAVPSSDVPDERPWPTQPFSPRGIVARQRVDQADVWGLLPRDRARCQAEFKAFRHDGVFTPPTRQGTIVMPGHTGGFHWGGVTVDPERRLFVAPVNTFPTLMQLLSDSAFRVVRRDPQSVYLPMAGTGWVLRRKFWLSPTGLPCIRPPWGELVAIDLDSGGVRWRTPIGHSGELLRRATGWPIGFLGQRGTPTLGGALTTRGGVTFIAAALDSRLRAFETATGKLLWEGRLPAPAKAAPMVYVRDGRTYVVVAAGGDNTPVFGVSDAVVAFALP